jgi:hypothetical protein
MTMLISLSVLMVERSRQVIAVTLYRVERV